MRNPLADQARQYELVARAIEFIRSNARHQPSLAEISDSLGLSEFHLQRIFSEWAGVSPKRFLQYVTKEYARQALRSSGDLLSVTQDAGLSSPGRLHDLMVACEAMSPGEIKSMGADLKIGFGETPTPFGNTLIAWTQRGICHSDLWRAMPWRMRWLASSKTGRPQLSYMTGNTRYNLRASFSMRVYQPNPCI